MGLGWVLLSGLATVVFIVTFIWYVNRVDELMGHITRGTLSESIKRFTPSPFNVALVESIQLRLRRQDEKYCVEARTFVSKWYTISIPYNQSPYGTWADKSTGYEDAAREQLEKSREDIVSWLDRVEAFDDTAFKDAVIETVSITKHRAGKKES